MSSCSGYPVYDRLIEAMVRSEEFWVGLYEDADEGALREAESILRLFRPELQSIVVFQP